jgi:NAD-dependent SIR2 family protein deacetylase
VYSIDQIEQAVTLAQLPQVKSVSYIGHGDIEMLRALVDRTDALVQVFDYSDQWRVSSTLAFDDEGITPSHLPRRPDWFAERVRFFAEGIAPGDLLIDDTFRLKSPKESGLQLLDYRQARVVYLPKQSFSIKSAPLYYKWTATPHGMVGYQMPSYRLMRDIEAEYVVTLARNVSRAASALVACDGIVITAGAGLGVDSGLPDFRGEKGFWRAYPALADSGIRFEDIADPASFDSHPQRGWGFYGHRLRRYRETTPHAGFNILKNWDASCPQGSFVVTSNVDGQFQKAGFPENDVWEIHGSIHQLQCTEPCSHTVWPATDVHPVVDETVLEMTSPLPHCPRCGALARPNILMFNDFAWVNRRATAQRLRFDEWLQNAERIVVIELGAGTAIPSIREMGQRIANRKGGTLIRINPRAPRWPVKFPHPWPLQIPPPR